MIVDDSKDDRLVIKEGRNESEKASKTMGGIVASGLVRYVADPKSSRFYG